MRWWGRVKARTRTVSGVSQHLLETQSTTPLNYGRSKKNRFANCGTSFLGLCPSPWVWGSFWLLQPTEDSRRDEHEFQCWVIKRCCSFQLVHWTLTLRTLSHQARSRTPLKPPYCKEAQPHRQTTCRSSILWIIPVQEPNIWVNKPSDNSSPLLSCLPLISSLPTWGPTQGEKETSCPCYVLSKFLTWDSKSIIKWLPEAAKFEGNLFHSNNNYNTEVRPFQIERKGQRCSISQRCLVGWRVSFQFHWIQISATYFPWWIWVLAGPAVYVQLSANSELPCEQLSQTGPRVHQAVDWLGSPWLVVSIHWG